MIKNIFRLTVIGYVWKRYKTLIISTLTLFVYFWIVSLLHGDFVGYIELNDDKQYLAMSFIIKWLAFAAGLMAYLFINSRYGRKEHEKPESKNKLADSFSSGKTKEKFSSHAAAKNAPSDDSRQSSADPFDRIRQRDKLRSRADFIIENTDQESRPQEVDHKK